MENPWSVDQLEAFLYFCCPECDIKKKDKNAFLNHAFQNHPEAKDFLTIFVSENIKTDLPLELEINDVKQEPTEEDFVDNFEDEDYELDEKPSFEIKVTNFQCDICFKVTFINHVDNS